MAVDKEAVICLSRYYLSVTFPYFLSILFLNIILTLLACTHSVKNEKFLTPGRVKLCPLVILLSLI